MASKHPYLSGSGPLFQIVAQLRKSFPAGGVTAETLKKLGLASNNEGYVINILRFIDVIDEEGKKTDAAGKIFNHHDDTKFQQGFAGLVKTAYSDLFSLHGDDAWKLERDDLIQYFRSSDETSAIVGGRQASVFQALSALGGHAEAPILKGKARKATASRTANTGESKGTNKVAAAKEKTKPDTAKERNKTKGNANGREVGLTVRIEINLPSEGDQETYDRIFKSIRENFIDA